MKFSDQGPDFPGELLDAMLKGDVVFLCGAGVSAPQLPAFKGLVNGIFEELGVDPHTGEQQAIDQSRFEEALGSLSRRIVHPSHLYRAAEKVLTPSGEPNLSNHKTLLRLSRDLNNDISIITTNFDPFFELAVADEGQIPEKFSFAGQALPLPGSEEFGGIIHIHGRFAHEALKLTETPLVLTSAEYGDAYMRSGWASRFLFDLARSKVLVLVGYSAGDAPVRYLLNVLQSDRERFEGLKPVYAISKAVDTVEQEIDKWDVLAVQAIPYQVAEDDKAHSVLWSDLEKLADLIGTPRQSRRDRARAILSKTFTSTSISEQSDLIWILKGKGDLWDIVLDVVEDPQWFTYFSEQNLWLAEIPKWLLPHWISRRWTNLVCAHAATRWCDQYGFEFVKSIENHLNHEQQPIADLWKSAWHILTHCNIDRIVLRRSIGSRAVENPYTLARTLQRPGIFDLELRHGIEAITPHIKLEPPYRLEESEKNCEPTNVRDIFRMSLTVGRIEDAKVIAASLAAQKTYARRILDLAFEAINSTIFKATDAGLISSDWDDPDHSVPAVGGHEQNNYRDGLIFLVELSAALFPSLLAQDRGTALDLLRKWRGLPTSLGTRMWLWGLALPDIMSIDDIINAILALPEKDFWAQRPELFRLIESRLGEANEDQIGALVERIAREGPLQFQYSLISPEERDWRPYARDHGIWVRLAALEAVNELNGGGKQLLASLRRDTHLKGPIKEEDYFSSYHFGVREVVGNPEPLLEAAPEDRLAVARELSRQPTFDSSGAWSAYCQAEPEQAFKVLTQNGYSTNDNGLWQELIGTLSFPIPSDERQRAKRSKLVKKIFDALQVQAELEILPLHARLVELFRSYAGGYTRLWARWWDRLWRMATLADDPENYEFDPRFSDRVINSAAGRLVEDLVYHIDGDRKKRGRPSGSNIARLKGVITAENWAGHMGRGALSRYMGFLVFLDANMVRKHFIPHLDDNGPKGEELRSVLCEWSQPTAPATKLLKSQFIRGVIESRATDDSAQNVAAKLLLPIFNVRLYGKLDWGVESTEVARALRLCGSNIRVGAALCLARWQEGKSPDYTPAEMWSKGIKPLFEAVWPNEKRFKSTSITNHLARCATHTDDFFPEALNTFKRYLTVYESGPADLYCLTNTNVAQRFPRDTLDLLWCLLKLREESIESLQGPETLDALKTALPEIVTDRRYQWLEGIVTRYV